MVIGLILLALIASVGVFSYRQSRLEQRLIKNISLIDWINLLVVPLFGYVGMVLIVGNILSRPLINVFGFNDFVLFVIGIPFLVYAFVGNSIHFVSKAISRNLKKSRSIVYRVNELFHGKLSHYMAWMCTLLAFFVLVLVEINHPLVEPLEGLGWWTVLVTGMMLGVSAARAIFYTSDWWGGNRSMFLFITAMFTALLWLFISLHLSYSYYPAGFFFTCVTASASIMMAMRRLFVILRWTRKRRLRFFIKLMLLETS